MGNDFINRPRCFDIVIDVKRTIPEHAKLNTKTTCIFMENKMSKIDAENYQKEKDRLSEPFEGASIIKRTSGWEQNHTIIEIHETEVHDLTGSSCNDSSEQNSLNTNDENVFNDISYNTFTRETNSEALSVNNSNIQMSV